jgi:hypothetical protein
MKCYECKHRGTVTGSAHSSCGVIKSTGSEKGPELEFMLAMRQVEIKDQNGDHIVKLNPHGIQNGWAAWPIDFDPVWVESCGFFSESSL